MAIWKKQNKEASACSNEKGKVLLSDDAMETVSGGQENGTLTLMPNLEKAAGGGDNLYSWIITTSGGPKSEQP
ncbi:MAG: hypothetical protein ACSW79_00570 [Eubacteriales bacterium]